MISEVLYTISSELPAATKEPFKGNYLADYIRNEAVDLIKEAIPQKFQHYQLKGSPGEGGWVKDKNAWIGIFSDVTHPGSQRASQGYYIEAHHIVPFSEMKKKGLTSRKISEKDIAMLCANCHRMIHKYKNMSIDQLKKLYMSRRKV